VTPWVSALFDPDQVTEWRRRRRTTLGLGTQPVIGVVGRLAAQKAQDRLIEALPFLPEAHLLVLGSGALQPEYSALAETLGVKNRTSFVGFKPDVETWMAACDVIAVPSIFEGFGRVAIEALALGIPVVASDIPGLRAALRGAPDPGVWLVQGEDRVAWAASLREALTVVGPAAATSLANFAKRTYPLEASVAEFRSILEEFTPRVYVDGK